ncbi:hypothetical protein FC24_GL001830 [Loigolactobacillus rennini DSM 20253]|uniref:DAGKc domain-containing protein n=1 Tax=Loigolactobacillus rennini DSM 20253 TaxID=1423796 RepID=A0A0R2CYH4_9LACO|nr:hypothetical protein FC24_GL001830 [Loigolactobacillus rennini DSM 20253]
MADVPSRQFYYIIINNFAGGGRTRRTWQQLAPILKQKQIHYAANHTQAPGHATQLAYQLALKCQQQSQPPILLVLGGDGTLHEALNGLQKAADHRIPLAYIPCGSGNDFARGAGITTNARQALNQVLKAQQPITLDIGRCIDHQKKTVTFFTNNIGIGFDANVVHITNRTSTKNHLNKYHANSFAYLTSLIKAFFTQKSFPVKITTAQQQHTFQRGFVVTTTNYPYFGGGVPLLASASVYNHHLDLVIMEKANAFYFIFLFMLMFLGQWHIKMPLVHHYHLKKLRIQSPQAEYGQADGEDLGKRAFDLEFNVTRQAFWFVPQT